MEFCQQGAMRSPRGESAVKRRNAAFGQRYVANLPQRTGTPVDRSFPYEFAPVVRICGFFQCAGPLPSLHDGRKHTHGTSPRSGSELQTFPDIAVDSQ